MANIPANFRQIERSGLRPAYGSRLAGPAEPSEALVLAVSVRQRPDAPPLPDHAYWMATPARKTQIPVKPGIRGSAWSGAGGPRRGRPVREGAGTYRCGSRVAGRTVVLSGTVEQVSRAFAVDLSRYESPMARIGAMRALSTSPLIYRRSSPQYSGSTTGGPVTTTA